MTMRSDIANESNRKLYQNHLASMSKLRGARLRIEKLETALQDIIDERGVCGHCGNVATGGNGGMVSCDKGILWFDKPCKWTQQQPKDIARRALREKMIDEVTE